MTANNKRITLMILTALMVFGFLVGGARLTAFAQEATMLSEQGSSQQVRATETSSQDDIEKQAGEFEVYGYVEEITATSLTIAGSTYEIQATTEFKSQVQVGDYVKLHVYPLGEGFAVREIEQAMLGEGDDNGNMNGDDDNGNDNDDNGNMNGDDDNGNDNDDNGNMNGDDDNGNDNDDNGNMNGDDDNSNDGDDDNNNDDDDDNNNDNDDDDDNDDEEDDD